MDPRHLTFDQRLAGFCVFCGAKPTTKDHIPARVFLDEPYPDEMRVVGACHDCNSASSPDEQYLACLLECVVCGSTDPSDLEREKVRKTIAHAPKLAERIQRGSGPDLFGTLRWEVEHDRARDVVVKLARGLVAYEEANPQLDEPDGVSICPLAELTKDQRDVFEATAPDGVVLGWPEIGSRAFYRAAETGQADPWRIVQPDRFRYRVVGTEVRMVLREYLGCVVAWD